LAADVLPQSQGAKQADENGAIVAGHRAGTGRYTKGQCQWQGNYTCSDATVDVSTNLLKCRPLMKFIFRA